MVFNPFKKKETKPEAAKATPVAAAPTAVPTAGVGRGTGAVLHMHVSEKSSRGQKMNQYTFVVRPRATKSEIAKDVAARYKVTVRSVKTSMLPGKQRRVGRYVGSTPTLKKAVVVIADGQSIANA